MNRKEIKTATDYRLCARLAELDHGMFAPTWREQNEIDSIRHELAARQPHD